MSLAFLRKEGAEELLLLVGLPTLSSPFFLPSFPHRHHLKQLWQLSQDRVGRTFFLHSGHLVSLTSGGTVLLRGCALSTKSGGPKGTRPSSLN